MLSCRARAAARLELDALGWSIRVSIGDRLFCGVSGFGLSYLAPFSGSVPTIRSPLRVVTLFIPFTGLNSLPVIVLGTFMAGLPCPLHLCTMFAFRALTTVLCLHLGISLDRLVFSFEYLQRLHDSIIGPALVQRWVLHDPWTYEPSRAMPYPEVHLLLHRFWSPFSFSGYAPFFCICLGIYFAFISVPDCLFCLGLGPFFKGCFGL